MAIRGRHPISLFQRRREVLRLLRAADELDVVFQPIVDLTQLACVGYEALARFPDGRSPDLWFNEARAIGLDKVLEMSALWRAVETFARDGTLSVNLSPATAVSLEFVDFVRRCPRHIELIIELTEHAPVAGYGTLVRSLGPIRDRGVKVAADDAGSGIASMRHVLAIDPDIIKLDCSLVSGIDRDSRRRALASSLEHFAEDVGATVLAEGIERYEEWEVCQDVGIALGQGFYFGRPSALPV